MSVANFENDSNRPTMKQIMLLNLAFYFLLTFSSCSYTTGEGASIEREFPVESFSSVEVDGSFDVSIDQSASQKVLAVGQENIIEQLKLNVIDDVLYISLEPGTYLNYELEVQVTMPDLNAVVLSGSGDIRLGTFVDLDDVKIELEGSGDIETVEESVIESISTLEVVLDGSGDIDLKCKAEDLKTELEGSGDIDLEGVAENHYIELDGSGDIDAYDLEAINAEANLDGSGSIRLYASKNLNANLDGSGDITYKGEPKVEASLDGSGNISAE